MANPVKNLEQALLSMAESDDHYCFYFYLGSNIIKTFSVGFQISLTIYWSPKIFVEMVILAQSSKTEGSLDLERS